MDAERHAGERSIEWDQKSAMRGMTGFDSCATPQAPRRGPGIADWTPGLHLDRAS